MRVFFVFVAKMRQKSTLDFQQLLSLLPNFNQKSYKFKADFLFKRFSLRKFWKIREKGFLCLELNKIIFDLKNKKLDT